MNRILKTHLRLARASNLPTTWSNVLCALLLVGGFGWIAFLGASVAVSCFYIGGMYLNDWRDAEHDRKHQSFRPIPAGRIARIWVLFYALVFFAAAIGLSYTLMPRSIPWALGLLGCIVAYDLKHKDNPLSPWLMAGCRALIYPWAVVLSGQSFTIELWLACAAVFGYTLGLTYISRGGLGFRQKLLFTLVVLLPAYTWMSYMGSEVTIAGLVALILFLLWMVHCLGALFCRTPRIGFTVGNLIAGFCLVDLVAVTMVSNFAWVALPAFLMLFFGTLKSQTLISGT